MTTIEKIREEIEQHKNDKFNCIGVNDVLKIIDKYAEQSGWEEMTVSCEHCGHDMTFKIATIGEPCDECKYKTFTELYFHTDPETIEMIEQEQSRDIKEIAEIMKCEADAETKCKMISNILTAKLHYFAEQEPCDDAISRQAIEDISLFDPLEPYNSDYVRGFIYGHDRLLNEIRKLPSVRPQEQTGHWEKIVKEHKCFARDDTYTTTEYLCSECGAEPLAEYASDEADYAFSNYCPNCGARMVEPQEKRGGG